MRLACFGIVIVLMMGWCGSQTNGQISDRILLQPGSHAYGLYQGAETMLNGPNDSFVIEDDSDMTDWEQTFGQLGGPVPRGGRLADIVDVSAPCPAPCPTPCPTPCPVAEPAVCFPPYLAYCRHPITHRIHVVPYRPGYAHDPCAYPTHQSKLNLLLSSLPCRAQCRPQIEYLGHYDPMPPILADKPSRCQLILGYPNPHWTSCCYNQCGQRLAQCPSVEAVAVGPPAEAAIRNQYYDHYVSQGPFPRPIGEGPAHQCHQCEQCQMGNY